MGGGQKGGGAQTVQQTTSSAPWRQQQPFLLDVWNRAQSAADQTPTTPFSGPFIAGANPTMQQANVGLQGVAGANQGLGQGALRLAQSTLAGDYLHSPYLADAIEAQVRPLVDQAREQTMPSISSSAWMSGAYGGDRHGLREAQAQRDLDRAIADTTARVMSDQYSRERLLQTQAPQMLQQGFGLEQMPWLVLGQTGENLQAWEQLGINDALAAYDAAVSAPWNAVGPFAQIVQGYNAGGTTSSSGTTESPGTNRFGSALGGALGGAFLGNALFPGLGGIIGGGLLGGLGGFF